MTPMRLAGMGVELVAGICGMGLFGWLADGWLGTRPWLTITGIVLGIIGSGYNFIRTALAVNKSPPVAPAHDQPDQPQRNN